MKLNIKEANIILESLNSTARNVAETLKWHEDWAKEHNVEIDEDVETDRAKLNAITAIIKRLEASEI